MNTEKAFGGVMSFLGSLDKMERQDFRKEALTTKIKKFTIDTACPSDTMKWETGVKKEDERWIIVEQYMSKKEATKGHKKWVDKVKKGEKKFKDIDMWGINE